MKGRVLLLVLVSLLSSQEAISFDFEKLFLPGKVIEGHKKYELECKHCHVRMRETTQKDLCLDCHEEIAKDASTKKGFHGMYDKALNTDCHICHTDHKGREANIIWLDKDRFDHKFTDYPLTGKHIQTECNDCHEKEKKYRQAPSLCIECHKDDDVHKNKLGDKCEKCHNPNAWTGNQFDHDKTDFKLRDSHKQVACDLCHIENKFKDTPKNCLSCHAIKDVHKKRFGNKCETCHNQEKWDKTKFDHTRDTKYKLKEKHRQLTCHTCHDSSYRVKGKKRISRTCYDCHKLDDVHKKKNGKECDQCHSEKSWLKSSFDHNKKTEFPLKGAHKKASCQACHQNDVEGKKTDMACYSCHRHEDVHKKQQGKKCGNCHNDNSWWLEDVRYDHELSDFPLIGQHSVVGCESCHLTSAFKDTKSGCNDCHQEVDVHKQGLGEDCERCHNPNDWLIWEFDHEQTDFRIEGAHTELHCHRCHFKPIKKKRKKKSQCVDCHNLDDIHDGNFGPKCDNCHTQEDFVSVTIQ